VELEQMKQKVFGRKMLSSDNAERYNLGYPSYVG
jgi:hypothetical protein